jgi:soluble lytic murein transglycosylase-like protein
MTRFFRTAVLTGFMGVAFSAAAASQCQVAGGKRVAVNAGFADKFELAMLDCEGSVSAPVAANESEQLRMYDGRAKASLPITTLPEHRIPAETAGSGAAKSAPRTNPSTAGQARRKLVLAPNTRAVQMVPSFRQVAASYDIDPLLLHAIAHVESRHNADAVSPAGARGVMQVMPATARRFGMRNPVADLHDPRLNLEVSSAYLKTLQGYYGNNLPLVLAAYNAGEGAVAKYGQRIPPYRETQMYVRDVMSYYTALKQAVARP